MVQYEMMSWLGCLVVEVVVFGRGRGRSFLRCIPFWCGRDPVQLNLQATVDTVGRLKRLSGFQVDGWPVVVGLWL